MMKQFNVEDRDMKKIKILKVETPKNVEGKKKKKENKRFLER